MVLKHCKYMRILLTIILIFSISSCKENDEMSVELFEEVKIPNEVIKLYEEKIKANSINKSNYAFEIRLWETFMNDSFPLSLKHVGIKNDKAFLSYFIFHTKDKRVIRSISQAKSKQLDYTVIKKDTLKLINRDSLLYFSKVISETSEGLKKAAVDKNYFIMSLPSKLLIEFIKEGKGYSLFLTNPRINKNYDYDYTRFISLLNFVNHFFDFDNLSEKAIYDELLQLLYNS